MTKKRDLQLVSHIMAVAVGLFTSVAMGVSTVDTCAQALQSHQSHSSVKLPARGYFNQYEEFIISDRSIALSVHSTESYEHTRGTKRATLRLNEFLKSPEIGLRTAALIHNFGYNSRQPVSGYYLTGSDIDWPIKSEYGGHRMKFTGLENVFLSGGALSICMRNAVRDLLENALPNTDGINLFLPIDAVYIDAYLVKPIDMASAEEFNRKFANKGRVTLKRIMPYVTGENRMKLLNDALEIEEQRRPGVSFNFYDGDTLLGTIGKGQKVVNIILTDVSSIKTSLGS